MRQLATLPAPRAESLADYLLTLRVETRLERLPEGVVVWVCDEDRLPEARKELADFESNPEAARYVEARGAAAEIRKKHALEVAPQEDEDEEEAGEEPQPIPLGKRPVTLALAAACVFVFTQAGPGNPSARDYQPGKTYEALMINSPATRGEGILADVRAGEAWRLFTPALLHFGWMHLVGNLLALVYLASAVEGRAGPVWLLALVAVLACASNVAEYGLGRLEWSGRQIVLHPSIRFGGMSGVLFGLVGYLWVRGKVAPSAGMSLPPAVWLMSLIAFALCWAGVGEEGPYANVAHTTGLLLGMALGLAPSPRPAPSDGPPAEEEATP